MSVNVIIVNWNGKKFLSECLESLRDQVYQSLAVTLVDNGSNDGSDDFVVQNYPEVKIIVLPQNAGFSAANNIALKRVKTEYVSLLNNDAIAHQLWLKNLVNAIETHPKAAFAA